MRPGINTARRVMITLQARIMLIAFVALAAAITYNATFLQKGPHPAPMAIEARSLDNRDVKSDRLPQQGFQNASQTYRVGRIASPIEDNRGHPAQTFRKRL